MKNIHLFSRLVLRNILNLWTIITMALFGLDFFSGNQYDSAASALGIIYLAILGIYVSNKEYDRWKAHFVTKVPGEFFVIIWTILMVVFVVGAPLSQGKFKIPQELAVIYTSVIGIFAITQSSKSLYQTKHRKRGG